MLAQESWIEKHTNKLDSNFGSINMAPHNAWNRKQFRGGNSNSSPQMDIQGTMAKKTEVDIILIMVVTLEDVAFIFAEEEQTGHLTSVPNVWETWSHCLGLLASI